MKRKAETIKVEDKLTLELVDRKTGKVVKRVEKHNAVGEGGAGALLLLISGKAANPVALTNWKYFYLFRPDKSLIKVLEGSFTTPQSLAGYYSTVFTAEDTTTDEYTTEYQGLVQYPDLTLLTQMYLWQRQSLTKTADYILRVRWEIRIPYTRP